MLTVEGVSKKLGSKLVLQDINLEVKDSSIFGLIGPNGAGKTSLLRCIVGIMKPDQGRVCYDGEPILENPHLKEGLGYVADYQSYYPEFKVKDMISLYRMSYTRWNESRFQELKGILKLPEDRKVKNLSKGMKTQLAFLLNLSTVPKLLVLDEPTSGLDPVIRKQVLNLIVDQVATYNTKVIISSHNLWELERICDQVAIINDGKITLSQEVLDLKEDVKKIQIAFAGEFPEELINHPEILSMERLGKVYTVVIKKGKLIDQLKGYQPLFIEEIDINLEEIFINQMGGNSDEQKAAACE